MKNMRGYSGVFLTRHLPPLVWKKKTPKQFCLFRGLPQNKTEQPNIVNLQDKTLPKFSFYMINDDLS